MKFFSELTITCLIGIVSDLTDQSVFISVGNNTTLEFDKTLVAKIMEKQAVAHEEIEK